MFEGRLTLGAIQERLRYAAFDESKVKRDEDGQFAEQPSSKEDGEDVLKTLSGDDAWAGKYKVGDKHFTSKKEAEAFAKKFRPQIIAKTEPTERADVENGKSWSEYRTRGTTEEERNKMQVRGNFVLERRRVRTDGDKEEPGSWDLFHAADSPEAAIKAGMGDSTFSGATSLHETHKAAAGHKSTSKDLADKLDAAKRDLHGIEQDVGSYIRHASDLWNKALAKAKSEEDKEKITKKYLDKYMPELDRLRAEIKQAIDRRDAAEKEYEKHAKPDKAQAVGHPARLTLAEIADRIRYKKDAGGHGSDKHTDGPSAKLYDPPAKGVGNLPGLSSSPPALPSHGTRLEEPPAKPEAKPAKPEASAPKKAEPEAGHIQVLKTLGVSGNTTEAVKQLSDRSAEAEKKAKRYQGLYKRAKGLFDKTGEKKYKKQMEMYGNSVKREEKKPGLFKQLIDFVQGKAPAAKTDFAPVTAPPEPEPPADDNPFAGWHEQTIADRWKRHREGDVYQCGESPARYSLEEIRERLA